MDENGSCDQPAPNQVSGEECLDDPMRKMRKGIFGRSASYLQGEETGESNQKDEGDDSMTGVKGKPNDSGTGIECNQPMEVDCPLIKTDITAAETIVETGISITPELAAGAVDGTDFGADEVDPSNKKMEQRKLESIGKGNGDSEQAQVLTTVTTIKNAECTYETKEFVEYEESRVEISHKTEGSSSVTTDNEIDMEHKVSEKPLAEKSETDVECLSGAEGASDVEASDTAAVAEADGASKVNEEIVKEGCRHEVTEAGKMDASVGEALEAEETPAAKVSWRSHKNPISETVSAESNQVDAANDKAQESDEPAGERRRSLRARKPAVDEEEAAKKESAEERRKSLRVPKKTPATCATGSTLKAIPREKKSGKNVSESEVTSEKAAASGKGGRKSAPAISTTSKSVQRASKKDGTKKKRGRISESDVDPFSFDSNFDNHPEPLRNIQMERQSFGGYKFTKSPEKTPISRYQKTEQVASERRSNLVSMLPQHEVTTHKSLSELAMSSPRQGGTASTSKRKTRSTGGEFTTDTEAGGSSRTVENVEESMQEDEIEGKLGATSKQKRTQSAYDFHSVPKARKRRMAEPTTPTVPEAKRPPKVVVPELSDMEQQKADRLPNEHAPYIAGARIYALWDRLYYPARISSEQDASGRYEVVFVEDGAVRRLVATGIIPLCNLIAGTKCLTTNLKDGEEVLEEVEIVEAPSLADAQQWMKGVFSVKNATSENTSSTLWHKLVLDSSQAKLLQVATVNTVRDINTENIASAETRRSRAARHSTIHEDLTPSVTHTTKTSRRRTSAAERDTPKQSAGKVEEIQQNEVTTSRTVQKTGLLTGIFSGITFVVTSAVRKNKEVDQGFSKKEIRYMIECGGGRVIDDVAKLPEGKPIYLIADTHYRTHKYLTALARSIPCVSNQWISDCSKENKLLDHAKYMLPAGVSLLTGELKPWHSNNGSLLSGKRVFIFSNNVFYNMPNFAQIWTPLMNHMGALVVSVIPTDGLDILLTDASCTEEILNKARAQGAIIVSSEWIIQSIIHGSLPAPDAHERFKYDYNDTC